MAKDYSTILNKLDDLKEILIQTIQSSNNNDELTKKLISLSAKDPVNSDLYQLILLVSSNTETNHNSFKQTSIRVITDIISHKVKIIESLQDHEDRLIKVEKTVVPAPKVVKIPFIGEIEVGVVKLKDIFTFVLLLIALLFSMNHLDKEAANKTMDDVTSVFKGTSK